MASEELEKQIREIYLVPRLKLCTKMIGKMCAGRRPPKMSIPVQWDDEDIFIITTIKDAIAKMEALEKITGVRVDYGKEEV